MRPALPTPPLTATDISDAGMSKFVWPGCMHQLIQAHLHTAMADRCAVYIVRKPACVRLLALRQQHNEWRSSEHLSYLQLWFHLNANEAFAVSATAHQR